MVNIVLYSLQPFLTAGLQVTLEATANYRLSSVCTTHLDLLEQIRDEEPTLVLVDLSPDVSLQFLKEIEAECHCASIILWVDRVSREFAAEVARIGVRGILRKTLSIELLLECFQRVAQGELWEDDRLSDQLLSNALVILTPQDREYMRCLAQGLDGQQTAQALGIPIETEMLHLSRISQGFGAKNRLELAQIALRNLAVSGTVETPLSHPGEMPGMISMIGREFVDRPKERRLQ